MGYEHRQQSFNVVQQAFPLAYGRIGERVLAIMFDDPRIEFFCVNAGGHSFVSAVQNPAWDWWWGIENFPLHTPVGYDGRLIYSRFESADAVVGRYQEYAAGRAGGGAGQR